MRLILLFGLVAISLGQAQKPHNAVNGGSSTNVPAWLRFFGDGSEGALSVTSGTTLVGEHWYTTVSVSSGAAVQAANPNTPLIIRATVSCTIGGTVGNNSTSVHPSEGNPANGDFGGTGGGGGGGTSAGVAGFANQLAGSPATILPGGTAGAASNGAGGTGMSPIAGIVQLFKDQGFAWPLGGSSGGDGYGSPGSGGNGGGVVVLVCPVITVTGAIHVSGAAGANVTSSGKGGGGGGGGGIIILAGFNVTTTGATLDVAGGAGGILHSGGNSGAGGMGGDGFKYVVTIQ